MTFFEIFSQIYKLSNISKLPQVIRIFKFSKKSCEFSSLEQRHESREREEYLWSSSKTLTYIKPVPERDGQTIWNISRWTPNTKLHSGRSIARLKGSVHHRDPMHPFFLPYSLLKISSTFLPPLTRPSPLDLNPAGNNVHEPVTH